MHQIEREILDVTHYKVLRKFSDRQDYLKSVFNAVQKLKNDEFDELTDEAATWANACVESYNRSRDSDLPDFDEVGDPDEDEDTVGDNDHEENGHDDAPDDDEGESEDEVVDETTDPDTIDDSGDDEDTNQDGILEDGEGNPKLDEDEVEKVIPPKKLRKPKPEVKKTKIKRPAFEDIEEDVELDKWGSMVGSKNSRALALFEKGATAGEVKDELGGTYYNILKKMVSHGHKLEKKGAVIKLTHLTEKGSKVSSPKSKSRK